MTTIHGFELVKEQNVPEINTKARLYRHIKSGAQLLSLENDDENKVFGINFCTPPNDSTGVAHIMEHSVLCGSRKYPVKEPFVELIKGSLKTFVNAMTFPDKTSYPVASQNLQDFYNLIDVYMDAVLYPRITPYTLQQEGWHYELESVDAPLAYKGVVFNEMKGDYSSPDSLVETYGRQSLFPNSIYGVDSGGDPKVIPNLTYEQFKAFHETYYHPSNALIFFYGDDNPDERLRLMQGYLDAFETKLINTQISLQPRFAEPTRVVRPYDPGEEEDSQKSIVTVNWMLSETPDPQTGLALDILEYILIGTPASPLRKALIESQLGEDLAGSGLEDQIRQLSFSTGLKGVNPDSVDQVEALILETLASLAKQGIDPATVQAAMNTAEFRLRELNTGSYPRGLVLMINALSTWLYGGDPLSRIAFEAPLRAVKDRLATGDAYFEGLIERFFLDNPHRTTLVMEPDPEFRERVETEEKQRLEKIKATMTPEQLQVVIENARVLKQMQETPDSPEALATIPTLKLSDLDKQIRTIPLAPSEAHGSKILYHDLFTNGIIYLDLGFDLHTLPQDSLPYIPLFSRALLEMGTSIEDFVKLSQRIGSKTGGIHPSRFTSAIRGQDDGAAWLFLRGKGTIDQTEALLAILYDILTTVKLDNKERFLQIVLEEKAGEEADLVPSGHIVVNTRLRSHFNEADWATEEMGGVSYLLFLRELAETIEKDWPSVLATLESIRQTLLDRRSMISNVTVDAANWKQFEPRLTAFLGRLPQSASAHRRWSPDHNRQNEALTIPAQVNYVAKGANLYKLGYELNGSIAVISNFLRTTWLWERIRVQGGAYGGFNSFDQQSGVFSYLSYRDPNLLGTLQNYDGASRYLREIHLHPDELTKSIIGVIGSLDAYQLPDAKGYTSMVRYLINETDERRQRYRDQVLSTSEADFKRFADVLDQLNKEGLVVVLGSQEAIQAAAAERPNWLNVTKVL